MDGMEGNPNSDVLQALLDQCPPFSLAGPWAFLPSDNLCRGSLTDPAKSLQFLLGHYSLDKLQEAEFVELTNYQGWRLRAELCNPVGGIIGLRGSPTRSIDSVMTSRGSLPHRLDPWTLAAKDLKIQEAIDDYKLLFVTFSFRDAVLLRALEMPAVIGLGLQNLGPSFLKAINELQGSEDFVPNLPAENEPAAAADKGKAMRTTGVASSAAATTDVTAAKTAGDTFPALTEANNTGLVLVGWSPYRLNFPYQTQLRRVADQFSKLRRFMGMRFPGISVWQIPSEAIENLKFRLRWQDPEIITDFLGDTLQHLQDLEKFASSEVSLSLPKDSAFTDFLSAQANLLHELTNDDSPEKRSQRIQIAQANYQKLVQSELISPLQEWALSHFDPVVRVVGVELGEVCRALHQMRPCLLALGENGIGAKRHKSVNRSTDGGFDIYLKLCKQFDSFVRELCLLRDS